MSKKKDAYNKAERYEFRYLDPAAMPDGSASLVIGMRGSGKSTVVRSLLYYKRHLKYGVCISGTERMNRFWRDIMPEVFIHGDINPKTTRKLMQMQEETMEAAQATDPPAKTPGAFAVYDDCLFDAKFLKAKSTNELLLNGRHFFITPFFISQYAVGIPKMLRMNFDYIFLLGSIMPQTRIQYFEQFGSMFGCFRDFCQAFDVCTADDGAMVIHQSCRKPKGIEDYVYWYKATPNLKYKIGDSCFWDYQKVKPETKARMLEMIEKDRQSGYDIEMVRKYPAENAAEDDASAEEEACFLRDQPQNDMMQRYQKQFMQSVSLSKRAREPDADAELDIQKKVRQNKAPRQRGPGGGGRVVLPNGRKIAVVPPPPQQ